VLIPGTPLQQLVSLIASHAVPGTPTYFLTVSTSIVEQSLEELVAIGGKENLKEWAESEFPLVRWKA
jgi:hypothetical protein